jgi:glyoxylate reductase
MQSKPLVRITRTLPSEIEARMAELFEVVPNRTDSAFSKSELIASVADADVLVPTITDTIDADVIAAAGPRLKLIANFGNGVDHIDVAAAAGKGILVTNTPSVLTDDTADMVMALILAVSRRVVEGARIMVEGGFKGWSPTWMLGHRVRGKAIGIIGMGRIGSAVAQRAKAFGMQVHYHNRKPALPSQTEGLDATFWPVLDDMLPHVDIVSINCPHTPVTYHILSAERLALMKPTAVLINTARGQLIDEVALCERLERKLLAGAGLDVFEREPSVNPRLQKNPGVVLLPHMGSATVEARVASGERVIVNIKTWADGHKPPDRILPV